MPDWMVTENRRLLREITSYYMLRKNLNTKTLVEAIELPIDDAARPLTPTYHTVQRFLYNQGSGAPRKDETAATLNTLFRLVVGWLHADRENSTTNKTRYLKQLEENGWFKEHLGAAATKVETQFDIIEFAELFSDTIEKLVKINIKASSREAARFFTGKESCAGAVPTADEQKGYATFRYSAVPGRVVRTFTTFSPPSELSPFCMFTNVYKSASGHLTKKSAGFVLALQDGFYGIGVIYDARTSYATGLKLLAFPKRHNSGIVAGLVTTVDENNRIITARVAMVNDTATHSDQCPPKIFPVDEIGAVPKEIIPFIRNLIQFEPGKKLYAQNTGEQITPQRMVYLVGDFCTGKFTIGDGDAAKSFNPADHRFYPFNQALGVHTTEEDQYYEEWPHWPQS
jgi:hypothetical protein